MHAVFRSCFVAKSLVPPSRLCLQRLPLPFRSYSHTAFPANLKNVDLYTLLKTTPNASQKQIKAAYYKQSLIWHPDRNKGSDDAHEKFTQLAEAYKILGDMHARREYDRRLKVETHYRKQETPFQDETIQRYKTDIAAHGSSRQYDTWTRTHYRDSLQKRDEREKRNELRMKVSKEESKERSSRFLIILSVICAALAVGMYETKKK